MKTTLKLLAAALVSVGLVACTSYPGAVQAWKPGNSKFTTGISAPQPEPRR